MDLIIRIKLVQPGPTVRHMLSNCRSERVMLMCYLKAKDGLCAWCEAGKLPSYRHKYCSRDCNESAIIFCYPQSLTSRGFHLIEYQAGACRGCGEYYGDQIFERVSIRKEKTSYHFAVYNIRGLEVDHIVPVFKGGWGIGVSNMQVLCYRCHRLKSGRERQK